MVVRQISLDGGGSLLVWHVTESREQLLAALQLPAVREGLAALHTDKRRREYLAVRVALRALLGREVEVGYEPSGRPFLVGFPGEISLSHSGDRVAVAYHPACRVGVDIECPTPRLMRLAPRFLGEDERRDLAGDPRLVRVAWSAKEALYKVVGAVAVDFASAMRLQPFAVQPEGECLLQLLPDATARRVHYLLDEAYTLVWTADNEQLAVGR